MNRWSILSGVGLAAAATTFAACGDSRSGYADGKGAFDTTPEAGTEPPAAPQCTGQRVCSRDLRSVVDACDETKVLAACPDDQACGDGACLPACDAAVSAGASIGCEFAALPPSGSGHGYEGSCFAAFLANTWSTPTRIEGEYKGQALDIAAAARLVRTNGGQVTYEPFHGELPPGEVAVVFLSQGEQTNRNTFIPCPDGVTPAVARDTSILGTARGASFRLRTSAPVSAYSIYPFGGEKSAVSSATLLLPVASWKPGYIVTNPWDVTIALGSATRPTTQIVAAEDDTEVTIVGSTGIQSGRDVEGALKGKPRTWKLARGEAIQLAQHEELTGSRISANKNIAVWGGHECMFVPSGQFACDASQDQLVPLQSWGSEYAVVPHLSRLANGVPEQYHYRIVGAVGGTTLTYEPSQPNGAPAELAAGEVKVFTSQTPFVVRSQDAEHPFAVYSYMNGYGWQQATNSEGDPELVSVIPSAQFLDRYVFFADPTYPNSQIVVVRSRDEGKEFEPVTLGCAGELDGWAPLGTSGKYEYTRVWLTRQRKPQQVGTGTCGAGRHELQSRGAVGVTVWGTGFAASYGYPGGAAIRKLNSVETIIK